MSSPSRDGSSSRAKQKRLTTELPPTRPHTDAGPPGRPSAPGSAKVTSKSSSFGLTLRLAPSTTMDALTHWNECLDRASENDPHFTSLDLDGQSYPADFVSSLSEFMKTNTHLVEINLSHHQTGNTNIKALCLGLRANNTLKKLAIAFTGIGVVAGQALCDLLMVNKTLNHLNIAGNSAIAECGPRFAEVLKTNKTLTSINVSECNFVAAPWRDALKWNSTLIELQSAASIAPTFELPTPQAGRALSATFGSKTSTIKPHPTSSSSPSISLQSGDRVIQPLTNEPNSECQLMVHTNRILSTLSSFQDENRDVEAFVAHLRRKHPHILVDACRRGHQAAVHRLLELGVDPNDSIAGSVKQPPPGSSSSHQSSSTPQPPLASASNLGSSSNAIAHENGSPLQEAILHGNVHIIKLLIAHGAVVSEDIVSSLPSSTSNPLRASSSVPATGSPSSASHQSLSREIMGILRDAQNGIIDLSNGTYQLFGWTSLVVRPGIVGLKLSNNHLGPNMPAFLMATLLQLGSDLTTLKLKGNNLQHIPSQIGDLTSLTSLSLDDNALDTLPASLGQLQHLKVLKLRKNPLSLLPEDVIKKGTQRTLQYLRDITNPIHPWTRMKLLVVGRENVGKTHLIRRLQKRDYSHNMSTDGLEISDVPITKKVDFCIFDFGGQQVFYPTHMFFLSDRALYTVVFSALDDESFRTVEYWLKVIRALAAGSAHTPVVLVATHMDDPRSAQTIPELKDRIKKLKQSYRSILRDVIYVSNTTGGGHKELKAKLIELAQGHKILTTPVPENYILMDKLIAKEKSHQRPLIMWSEYRAIARNAHIYDDSTLRACSQFMHDVGNVIWFNQKELSELVILDPQWLSDVMASVISFKANWKSGLLQHDSLPIVWKHYPVSLHKTLLGILERFEVVFSIRNGEGASIVPTMLPDTCSEVMETFTSLHLTSSKYQRIERTYRFGFMPIGFFSRLLARLFIIPNIFCHDPWLRGVMLSPPAIFDNIEEQFDNRKTAEMDASEASSPLSGLLGKFLWKHAISKRNNIHLPTMERSKLLQQYATLTALMRGFEQASIRYFEASSASILNIVIWRPFMPTSESGVSSYNLMTYIVDTVEELLSTNYKKYDDSIERIMVHSSSSNPSCISEFSLPQVIKMMSDGETKIQCKDEIVALDHLAPDICFTDVYRFSDVQIEKELGEGGVGLIFLASVPNSEVDAASDIEPSKLISSAPPADDSATSSTRTTLQVSTPSAHTDLVRSNSDPTIPPSRSLDPLEGDQKHGNIILSVSASILPPSSSSHSLMPVSPSSPPPKAMETINEEIEHSDAATPSNSATSLNLAAIRPDASALCTPSSAKQEDNATQAVDVPKSPHTALQVPTDPIMSSSAPESESAPLHDERTPSTFQTGSSEAPGTPEKTTPRSGGMPSSSSAPVSPHVSRPERFLPLTEVTISSSVGVTSSEQHSGPSSPTEPALALGRKSPALRRSREKKNIFSGFTSSSEDLPHIEGLQQFSEDTSRPRRLSTSDSSPRSGSGLVVSVDDLSHSADSYGDVSNPLPRTVKSGNRTRAGSGLRTGRMLVALKRFKVADGMQVQRFREFAHEVRLMASLNHPCIVRLYGIQLSPLGMVMEYISGKDLCSILHNPAISEEVLTWRVRAKLALDVARGMRYLQTQSPPIVHRDLRSPNIFVMGLDEHLDVSAKVADFGLSMRVLSSFSDVLQTWQWLAPEVIDMSHCNYDETSDIYSYGIVLWEIATRKWPFSEYTAYINKDRAELSEDQMKDDALVTKMKKEGWEFTANVAIRETYNRQKFVDLILKENLRPTIPSKVPPAFAKLIEMCWAREPSQRPNFNTIVAALSKMLGFDRTRRWVTKGHVSGSTLAPPNKKTAPISISHPSSKLEPALEDETSNSSSPGSESSMPASSGTREPTAQTPAARQLASRKTNTNLMSTITFLQKVQDDGDDHGLDDVSFQNLVTTPGDAGQSGTPGSQIIGEVSPREDAPQKTNTRGTIIHSSNLGGGLPTSSKAPVILTRVLEETLSLSALAMVQVDENRVWVGQQDGRIAIFDTSSPPKFVSTLAAHKKEIFGLAVVGADVWAGSADTTISVWSAKKMKLKKVLKDHGKMVRCVLSIPKLGKTNLTGYVISGDTDGTVIVWKNMSAALRFSVGDKQPINSMVYVEESRHLWIGTYRKIYIYSVQDWSLVTAIEAHEGMISAMIKLKDMLWTCCSNTNSLACWDTASLVNRMTIKGTPRITCLALVTHPINGTTHLWAGSLEKVIYIYDCSTGELVESLKGHTDYVYCMVKLWNEQSVWSAGRDCLVRTWNF